MTDPRPREMTLAAIIMGLSALVLVACNPSPKAKAILADEEIRREVCAALTLPGYDFPGLPYSRNDTEQTKEYAKQLNRMLAAYCH